MKKILLTLFAASFFTLSFGTERILSGEEARKEIKDAIIIRYKNDISFPNYVEFAAGKGPMVDDFNAWLSENLPLENSSSFEVLWTTQDELGFEHLVFEQYISSNKVQYSDLRLHVKGGQVVSFSATLSSQKPENTHSLTEDAALKNALDHIGASLYFWEDQAMEELIKDMKGDTQATYFPEGEKVFIPSDLDFGGSLIPAWKFNISALEPAYGADVYVNATTGEILLEDLTLKHIDTTGTAKTHFSGLRTMTTDYRQGKFYTEESGRGGGIETYDMLNGTSFAAAVILSNDSNYWHDTLPYKYSTDAHWGAEQVYDYYLNIHGRNSLDDKGFVLRSYTHYGVNYANAFWNGQFMAYGDGSSTSEAFTALDVCGHEFTHGVDQFSSNLVYQDEPGALDESFADIFGNTVEFHVKPDPVKNWEVGEDRGTPIRSMSNPKRFRDPDTYGGQYYYTGPSDNGGVHTNSGVQNFWFYLLSVGGSGTNDNGDAYNVTAITIQKAEKIAYRNRAKYLSSNSDHEDARFYSLLSARDLYGGCGQEVRSTAEAWYAVGVGGRHTTVVTADFDLEGPTSCKVPFEVTFENLSNHNANTYLWEFGDGNTSNQFEPTHTYTSEGTYTVKLTATGGFICSSNSDTETKASFIQIDIPDDVDIDPYTICEGYAARIRASTPDQAFWFIDSSDVTPVFIGNPYVSQPLTQDTFFYVANGWEFSTDSVGIPDNSGLGGNHTTPGYGLEFDVLEGLTLESVTVYSGASGYRGIDLIYDDTVRQTELVNLGVGEFEVDLNFKLEPKNGYVLRISDWVASVDLYRNNSGANYPYKLNGLISIERAVNPDYETVENYYYYFYNWKVKRDDCIGTKYKAPVTIDYDPNCIPYVGVEEKNSLSQVKVYPNPTRGAFSIDFEIANDEELMIQMIDARGAVVFVERDILFNKGMHTYNIDGNSLSKGIYIVQIIGQSINHTQRLVVE